MVEFGVYSGVRVGTSDLAVTHLQYEDDTLLLEDPTIEKLWNIKVIQRGLEFDSGLWVNFYKSDLVGG